MQLTETMLRAMARGQPPADNLRSVLDALTEYGPPIGLDRPHRLAHFLAQVLHESGSFKFDREIWGPTPAQKRYEGRKDLGNLQPGDGSRYRGRGPIQITGRANYRAFTKWARSIDPKAPDFEKTPEAVNTGKWEGLGPIWYWSLGNPTGKSLNAYADDNNIEMITRRINGGLNGFDDRVSYYVRAALVILGYAPDAVRQFQRDRPAAGAADGIAGAKTRMAMHQALKGANPFEIITPVEIAVETPVVPASIDAKVREKTNLWSWITGIFGSGGVGLAGFLGADWQTVVAIGGLCLGGLVVVLLLRRQIISAVRQIKAEVAEDR
jgi:putative chitinase